MNPEVDLRELAIDRGSGPGSPRQARRHLLTRYLLPLMLVVGFLSLVGWSAWEWIFPPQPVKVVPVLVTTASMQQAGTPLFQAAGWIEPRPTPLRVAALAAGVVERLLVVEDQLVKAGDPIAELVTADAELVFQRTQAEEQLHAAALNEASAALAAAETRLSQPVHLQAALGDSEAALAKIETALQNLPFEIRRAEADHDAANKDYEGKLAAEGVVSGTSIDIAKSKAESAAALVEELRDRRESLGREQQALVMRRDALSTQLQLLADEIRARDEARAQVQGATARLAQARVAVAEAKLQLDRMTITAPVDGRIFRLIAHPGARVGSGSGMAQMSGHDGSTVVTMYRPEMLQIRVDVRFEDIPKVSLGQPVEINNPALTSRLEGKVLFISSEADIQKNTLQVKVAIPDPPAVFKPEMLVDVTFLAPQSPGATRSSSQQVKLFLPQQLIHSGDQGPFVWIADQSGGVARYRSVQTGPPLSGRLVQITAGLTVSSRVISTGSDGLIDGQRIRVTAEDPQPGTIQDAPSGQSPALPVSSSKTGV